MDNFIIQPKRNYNKQILVENIKSNYNNSKEISNATSSNKRFKFWKKRKAINKTINENFIIDSSFEAKIRRLNIDRKINKNFREIMNYFRPLDLLLFDSDGTISTVINTIQKFKIKDSKWSHVGILVNKSIMPYISNLKEGKWYIWESVMTQKTGMLPSEYKIVDIETQEGVFGVQIRDLELVLKEKIKKKDQRFAIAKLINSPFDNENLNKRQELISKIKKIQKDYFHRKYDFNITNHMSTVIDLPKINLPIKLEKTSLYCSEFAAIVYKELGLLSADIDIRKISPADLANATTEFKQSKNLLSKILIVQETICNLIEKPTVLF